MLMENKLFKKINIDHIFFHGSYQALAGIVYGFGIYMLMERGFNSAQAGWCMAGGNLLSLIIQPIISNFLDNSKKVSVFKMLIVNTFILMALFLINLILKSKSIALCFVFIAIVSLYSSNEPLINSLSNIFISNNINIEFGLARSIGSLTYGTISALFGILSQRYSFISVLLGGFILSLFFTLVALITSKDVNKTGINVLDKKNEEQIGYRLFFKNQKNFILLCLSLCGVFFGYTCIDNFMLLVSENVGGNSADMGIILGIKAVIEFAGIVLSAKLIKKYDVNKILIFAVFSTSLKTFVTCLANNIIYIYLSQIIQFFSFAFLLPGMVEYVNINMNKNEAIRGQAFFTMSISLGSMLSSLIGGTIAEEYSVLMMEYMALIIGIISAILFTIIIRKNKNGNMPI